jgi:hypothetical protein
MDRRLTVKQEEVRVDGAARHLGGILCKDGAIGRWNRNGIVHLCQDEDALFFTGYRGIVRFSCHGVNLLRRFLVREYC